MKDKNWRLEYGYVSSDAVTHKEYHGNFTFFKTLETALEAMRNLVADKVESLGQGVAASLNVMPTENVRVDVHIINEPHMITNIIVVDDSPLYFVKMNYCLSESALLIPVTDYISGDVTLQHNTMFRFYVVDYYMNYLMDSSLLYDNGRFFNDNNEIWVCPHCKTVYLDRDMMIDSFVIDPYSDIALLTHAACGGKTFVVESHIESAIEEVLAEINNKTNDDYYLSYLLGSPPYELFCKYHEYLLTQELDDGWIDFITKLSEEIIEPVNGRRVNNVQVKRMDNGTYKAGAEVTESVIKVVRPELMLGMLTAISYGIDLVVEESWVRFEAGESPYDLEV